MYATEGMVLLLCHGETLTQTKCGLLLRDIKQVERQSNPPAKVPVNLLIMPADLSGSVVFSKSGSAASIEIEDTLKCDSFREDFMF